MLAAKVVRKTEPLFSVTVAAFINIKREISQKIKKGTII